MRSGWYAFAREMLPRATAAADVLEDPVLPRPAWADRVPAWAWLGVLALARWVLREGGYGLVDRPGGLAVFWPPAGLLVFALFVARRREWPLVAAVALAVSVQGSLAFGRTLGSAAAFGFANLAGAFAARWLAVAIGGRPTLRTLRGTLTLTLAPTLALGVTTAASHVLLTTGHASFSEERFWVFWLGSSLGILLVGSTLVEWTEPEPPAGGSGAGAAISVAGIVGLFAAGLVLLRTPGLPLDDVLLLPPLLWAAVRFGPRGATIALPAGAVAFVLATRVAAERGGGGIPGTPETTIGLQVFLWVGSASILAIAAVGDERRKAEQRRVLLERAMDQIPDAAAIYAEDGTVVWANTEQARQLGVSRDALVGHRAWEVAWADPAEWRRAWETVAGRGTHIAEGRRPGPAGEGRIPVELAAAMVRDGGRPLMVTVLRDLTDRRRAEESSRLAALGTLAAGVAHEINNPLSYVVANVVHVQERLAGSPDGAPGLSRELAEPLAEAVDGARRVRDIVRQLRSFARPEEQTGPVDPARALRAALAMAHGELRHRARLATDLAPTPPVLASENRLTQVFLNLLMNAAQAIPEGAVERNEVRVALHARDREVALEISDTGQGMTEEVRARIFEPFYTTKGHGEGTGLGLAISHSIVTAMGGRIEVESAPGKGSTFRVVLPAAEDAGPAPGGAGGARPG